MQELGALQKMVYEYKNNIINLVGVGAQWAQVHPLKQEICSLLAGAGEILCAGTIDIDKIQPMYLGCQFA